MKQRISVVGCAVAAALCAPHAAAAGSEESASVSLDGAHAGATGIVLGGKVGGIAPFGGLSPFVTGALEVGYAFPAEKKTFVVALDVDYTAPKAEGSEGVDPRLGATGAAYSWHLTEQQLVFMPLFMYRLTSLGSVVPYFGIGPRIYLLRSNVKGESAGNEVSETTEQSTKFGGGLPLGVEFTMGPGGLLAEVLLQYGPLDHAATGDSNTGGATLYLGYRFLL